jgi:6-phosphogluconate dehydrogenase
MKVGFVGLGRMGLNMVRRLSDDKHEVVAFDINPDARQEAVESGIQEAISLAELVQNISPPRVIWIMVPAGEITDETIKNLAALMQPRDIVIDGGNSNYKDSISHGEYLKMKGIYFLDAGTSGGIWGLQIGYCLMVGGEKAAFSKTEPLFRTLAPENGYAHVGPSGAGHFVKMVHNGIEYAMLQAYAEGFELLHAKETFNLDLHAIAKLWNRGSVIRSWLLELAEDAFENDPVLDSIQGYVEDSGEGRWTVENAIELSVPAPTIALSLFERFRSRQDESFGNRVIAALRKEFGGHRVVKK